jgi:hypothetical protein
MVLIYLLVLFAVFVIWFPAWMIWPNALISRVLALLFGITFVVFGLASRFSSLIDGYIKRKRKSRRVIHIEFAAAELPHGLDWNDRV